MSIEKIITITGDLGSGKSALSESLASKLGFRVLRTGDIQRSLALKMGMSTLELNEYSLTHPEIDHQVDKEIMMVKDETKVIVDSRMAWHFIPNSLKIFLSVPSNIAAKRIHNSGRKKEVYESIADASEKIKKRKELENIRFSKLYSVDCTNLDNFDLPLDTSTLSPEDVSKFVVDFYLNNPQTDNKCFWISPMSLLPTQSIRYLSVEKTTQIRESLEDNGFIGEFPIEVFVIDEKFYIYDGHKRVSGSILSKIKVIPCVIINKNKERLSNNLPFRTLAKDSCKISDIYDWEDAHQFTFDESLLS